MGNKRKGQLTFDKDWHKHLRKMGKRFFWKGERLAEKKMIQEDVIERKELNELPMLTFEKLFDLVEENYFKNEIDQKIATKILEAENDWPTSIQSLNDFILILEREIGGKVTQTSLNYLISKYNQNLKYSWEGESVCTLLEIFELTEEVELKKIFNNLIEKSK